MKTQTRFQCEICHTWYDDQAAAVACEAQGIMGVEQPVGLIFNTAADPKAFYAGMTFAVAKTRVDQDSHYRNVILWACRDGGPPNRFQHSGASDSLDADLCGNGRGATPKADRPSIRHPTFARMVAYLQSRKITPTCWDGSKPVALDDYVAKFGGNQQSIYKRNLGKWRLFFAAKPKTKSGTRRRLVRSNKRG